MRRSDELGLGERLTQDTALSLRQTSELLAHESLPTVTLDGRDLIDVEGSEEVLHLVPAHRLGRFHARRHPNSRGLLRCCDPTQALAQQQLDRRDPRTHV